MLKIDGKRDLDFEAATEKGVTRRYKLPGLGPNGGVGFIEFTFCWAAQASPKFQLACEEVRARLGMEALDDPNVQMQLVYDGCILSWSTDLAVGGKTIKANKANFIELAKFTGVYDPDNLEYFSPEIAAAFGDLLHRVNQASTFYLETKAASEKN